MSNKLSGASSLAYQGTNAASPSNVTVHYNAPTSNYYQGFQIGDFWVHRINPTSNQNELWVLMGVAGNVANWVLLSNGFGSLLTLTGNTGGAVAPTLGNIDVLGSGGILVAGNPGTSTLTISPSGGSIVSTLTGNSGGAVSPLAGNINVVGDTTTINIVGNPGTHTLTASTSGAVATSYITNPVTDTAVPSAGVLTFAGAGGITASAAGSTVTFTGSGGTVTTLHTDDTHNVTATSGVINIAGGTGIVTTGTIGPNTVTIATSGAVATSYITNPATGTAVPSAGALTFAGTGGLVATAAGSTITYGINTVAFTFTPTIAFGGASVDVTYGFQQGYYQVIGDIVFYNLGIVITDKGTSFGTATLEGLPFASSAGFQTQFGQLNFSTVTFPSGTTYPWAINVVGTTSLQLAVGGSGVGLAVLTDAAFTDFPISVNAAGLYFTN